MPPSILQRAPARVISSNSICHAVNKSSPRPSRSKPIYPTATAPTPTPCLAPRRYNSTTSLSTSSRTYPSTLSPPVHRHISPSTSIPSRRTYNSSTGGHGSPSSFLPVPFVTEQLAGAHHTTDLFSRLLKERIVCVYGPVEDRMSATITASLLFLESDSSAPISMYINSPGGSVTAGLSIYDTMQYIASPVHTIVLGQAASMGSLLACAGDKRYALPHATIMMHQPSGGYEGTSADIQIHAKEILRLRDLLNGIYGRHLGRTKKKGEDGKEGEKVKLGIDEIERLMERDYFMSAEEARELGVVDEVLGPRGKVVEGEEGKKGV